MWVLGEAEDVVLSQEAFPTHPVIGQDKEGTWGLYVEKTYVCPVSDVLSDALLTWAIAHYIFHQKTHERVKNSNWYLRKRVLQLTPEKAPGDAARKAIDRLEE